MPPKLELSHHFDCGLDLMHDGVRLFRYTYRPDVAQSESPKPYFHPLRTLSGHTVTRLTHGSERRPHHRRERHIVKPNDTVDRHHFPGRRRPSLGTAGRMR